MRRRFFRVSAQAKRPALPCIAFRDFYIYNPEDSQIKTHPYLPRIDEKLDVKIKKMYIFHENWQRCDESTAYFN